MYLSLGKQAKRQVSINVLSWRTIAKSLKALSFGLLECDNKNDVIGYVKVDVRIRFGRAGRRCEMSNIGLSFDFKEVNSMLRNKSLSELKESLSYLLLNYAELIEDKNIHEFIADISTLRFVFDMLASIKPIETEGGTL